MISAAKATLGLFIVFFVVFLGEVVAFLANTSPFTPGFVLAGLLIVIGLAFMKSV